LIPRENQLLDKRYCPEVINLITIAPTIRYSP